MSIALSIGNNLTTSGVFKSSAVNNTSVNNVTTFPLISGGTLKLLSTQTASASASINFTTGIDSTYDEYIFKFINIHPSSNSTDFDFQVSTNGGGSYGVAITSTWFQSAHNESDTTAAISYETAEDLAQSTSFQTLNQDMNADNDASNSGYLHLFNPSSTTYVKHFMAVNQCMQSTPFSIEAFAGGYINSTSAINAVRFKMSSGNIDDGIIKLYGVVN